MSEQTAFAHPQRDAKYPAIPMAQIAQKAVVHGVEQITGRRTGATDGSPDGLPVGSVACRLAVAGSPI